jgi:hypothetical protein
VNRDEVDALRTLLAPTGWPERARTFARALRVSTTRRGGLLLVGTPAEEPWHLTAHLDEESRLSGIAELAPTLVRWEVPPGAPPHLRFGLERLEAAQRGETVFVVTPATAPVPLLERVSDARKVGATIFALDQGDPELDGLAHESLTIAPGPGVPGMMSFGVAQHLVSAACGELGDGVARADEEFGVASRASGRGVSGYQRYRPGVRGLRDRVAHLLDVVSGPTS